MRRNIWGEIHIPFSLPMDHTPILKRKIRCQRWYKNTKKDCIYPNWNILQKKMFFKILSELVTPVLKPVRSMLEMPVCNGRSSYQESLESNRIFYVENTLGSYPGVYVRMHGWIRKNETYICTLSLNIYRVFRND